MLKTDKELTLSPCPFCGEEIELIDMRANWNKDSWRIWHPHSPIRCILSEFIKSYPSKKSAIEAWNTRQIEE